MRVDVVRHLKEDLGQHVSHSAQQKDTLHRSPQTDPTFKLDFRRHTEILQISWKFHCRNAPPPYTLPILIEASRAILHTIRILRLNYEWPILSTTCKHFEKNNENRTIQWLDLQSYRPYIFNISPNINKVFSNPDPDINTTMTTDHGQDNVPLTAEPQQVSKNNIKCTYSM